MAQNRYVFAQRDVDDFSCIKIVEGNYKDVIYTYGKVQFASEENAQGEMPLKFTYDVKENPNNVDTTSIDFRKDGYSPDFSILGVREIAPVDNGKIFNQF